MRPETQSISWAVELAAAQLDDVLTILSRGGRVPGEWRRPATVLAETLLWVRSHRTDAWSFACCCDLLGLDVSATRARLLAIAAEPPGERKQFGWKAA